MSYPSRCNSMLSHGPISCLQGTCSHIPRSNFSVSPVYQIYSIIHLKKKFDSVNESGISMCFFCVFFICIL